MTSARSAPPVSASSSIAPAHMLIPRPWLGGRSLSSPISTRSISWLCITRASREFLGNAKFPAAPAAPPRRPGPSAPAPKPARPRGRPASSFNPANRPRRGWADTACSDATGRSRNMISLAGTNPRRSA